MTTQAHVDISVSVRPDGKKLYLKTDNHNIEYSSRTYLPKVKDYKDLEEIVEACAFWLRKAGMNVDVDMGTALKPTRKRKSKAAVVAAPPVVMAPNIYTAPLSVPVTTTTSGGTTYTVVYNPATSSTTTTSVSAATGGDTTVNLPTSVGFIPRVTNFYPGEHWNNSLNPVPVEFTGTLLVVFQTTGAAARVSPRNVYRIADHNGRLFDIYGSVVLDSLMSRRRVGEALTITSLQPSEYNGRKTWMWDVK